MATSCDTGDRRLWLAFQVAKRETDVTHPNRKLLNRFSMAGQCLLLSALLAPWSHAVPILELVPDATAVTTGDTVSVDVNISQLDGDIVSAFSLFVAFDPDVLSVTDVQFGSDLGALETGLFCDPVFFPCSSQGATLPSDPGGNPGLAEFSELSFLFDSELQSLQNGAASTLATLSFVASGVGATALSFVDFALAPGLSVPAGDVKGFFGDIIDPLTLRGTNITVAAPPVPVSEPAALPLLLLGMLLVGVRRRIA